MEIYEEWRPIPEFPNYMVSTHGRVYSRRSGLMLKPAAIKGGRYLQVRLYREGSGNGKQMQVHRLVLAAFAGPCPSGQCGMHLDDNGLDNRLENLAWGTTSENVATKVRLHRERGLPRRIAYMEHHVLVDGVPPGPYAYVELKCRCKDCTEAYMALGDTPRARRIAAPTPSWLHGTLNAYQNYNCRCEECLSASRALYPYARARRRAVARQNERTTG